MQDVRSDRYRDLVDALGRERGFRRGWKSEVARLLQVHPSHISRIVSGAQVHIGRDAVERACERLGISEEYFNAQSPTDYTDFLQDGRQRLNEQQLRAEELAGQWSEVIDQVQRFCSLSSPTAEDAYALGRAVRSSTPFELVAALEGLSESNMDERSARLAAVTIARALADSILGARAQSNLRAS